MPAPPLHAHWIRVPRFMGDAVMIHCAIAPLRATGLPLVVWGPGWVVDLFAGAEGYAAVVAEPDRKYSPLQAAKMLRAHRPASVICFPKSQRPMTAAFLARVPKRLGCGDGVGRFLLTHSVQFKQQDTPYVTRYRSVVDRAFPNLAAPAFQPFCPRPEALARAAREREAHGLGDYVVFAPGANSHSKRLAPEAFQALGKRFLAQGLRPTILGAGPADAEVSAAIRAGLPEALDFTGQFSLAESAAWLLGARAMVGVDSGLAHLSAACGVPTLTIFGPTKPHHSAPLGPRTLTLRKEELTCLECMGWTCPIEGHPCMNQWPEARLWDAVQSLLSSVPPSIPGAP